MDVHRLLQEKGGALRLSGLQPRVETMISMTGVHKIVPSTATRRTLSPPSPSGGAAGDELPPPLDRARDPARRGLLAVLEGLYREVTLRRQFKGSFEDMMREIEGLVEQMGPEDQRRYLVESLFLNYNTYESEVLDATRGVSPGRGRGAGAPRVARDEDGRRPPRHGRPPRRRGRRGEGPSRPADPRGAGELRLRQGSSGKVLRKEFALRNFGDAPSSSRGCRRPAAAPPPSPTRGSCRPGARPPSRVSLETPQVLWPRRAAGARPVERPEGAAAHGDGECDGGEGGIEAVGDAGRGPAFPGLSRSLAPLRCQAGLSTGLSRPQCAAGHDRPPLGASAATIS